VNRGDNSALAESVRYLLRAVLEISANGLYTLGLLGTVWATFVALLETVTGGHPLPLAGASPLPPLATMLAAALMVLLGSMGAWRSGQRCEQKAKEFAVPSISAGAVAVERSLVRASQAPIPDQSPTLLRSSHDCGEGDGAQLLRAAH
jgi:hypothetical protein